MWPWKTNLNSQFLDFLTYKVDIIIVPTWQSSCSTWTNVCKVHRIMPDTYQALKSVCCMSGICTTLTESLRCETPVRFPFGTAPSAHAKNWTHLETFEVKFSHLPIDLLHPRTSYPTYSVITYSLVHLSIVYPAVSPANQGWETSFIIKEMLAFQQHYDWPTAWFSGRFWSGNSLGDHPRVPWTHNPIIGMLFPA